MNAVNNRDRVVRFGQTADQGFGPNKAYPFIYSFVNKEADRWDLVKAVPPTITNNMSSLGVTVPAQTTGQHVIVMDNNCNFKMLFLRYSAYYINSRLSQYEWYENETGWRLDYADVTPVGTPLINYLTVLLSCRSDSKYIYGTPNPAINAQNPMTPIPVAAIQGYETGVGTVRTPYLFGQSSQMLIEITNNHPTKDLIVCGAVYGMKVRI